MVTRQRLRVGAIYVGKIATVHVEDTRLRVTCDRRRDLTTPLHRATTRHLVESQIHALKADYPSNIS
jgi:hypothetical protein